MLHENHGLLPSAKISQSIVGSFCVCAQQGAPRPVESSFWHWTCQWVYGNIMEHLQEGIFLPFLPLRNVMHRIITPQISTSILPFPLVESRYLMVNNKKHYIKHLIQHQLVHEPPAAQIHVDKTQITTGIWNGNHPESPKLVNLLTTNFT